MGYPRWQTARSQVSNYQPRVVWDSSLYQIIYNYRYDFEYQWSELFEHKYGVLRQEVLTAFDAYLNCGVVVHGCALVECESCPHSQILAFSCKRRGLCPSCDAKRACIFAEHMHKNVLLPYSHRHLTWTIPKRLRIYFKFNRKLNKYLYWAANEAWNEYVSSILPNGRTGTISALHSSGDLLGWHPHLHMVGLNGVQLTDGQFVELPEVDTKKLEVLFADNLFAYLLKEVLITEDVVDNMKSWEHSGFNVYAGDALAADDADGRLFVARYLKKCPVSLSRISVIENGAKPIVRYTKQLDDGEMHRDFSPLEFLAQLQMHVPDLWEQTTRFTGAYSARARGKKRREEYLLELRTKPVTPLEYDCAPNRPSQQWAIWIKKIFEVDDPLKCPECGGRMRIKSFIHNPQEIARLTKHLGIQSWRAPPPIGKTTTDEQFVDFDYCQ